MPTYVSTRNLVSQYHGLSMNATSKVCNCEENRGGNCEAFIANAKKAWVGLVRKCEKNFAIAKRVWAGGNHICDLYAAIAEVGVRNCEGSRGVMRPLLMALSNPTAQSECTAEEAYTWSEVRSCYFASGSPLPPMEYNNKLYISGQANNCSIFPGFGFGLVMSGAIRVHNDTILAASEALAAQVTEEHFAKGMIYPPFGNIRKISAYIIAASVAAKTYELGVAIRISQHADSVTYAESCMYTPNCRKLFMIKAFSCHNLLNAWWPELSDIYADRR
ncbi:PREDICTED: NADP-dependent malic enzyme, chloroplastic-like [Nicotiana attenuata]|uniref:NADP-dependent malic enzyme, chloroplastic-like n=1 Tax=Nicotiana attenuata TaxID=49451 RepID=UPI0009057387|nr:PREDICTED: NADP-dependent malic enzyme, chloroplastic-like [Nicotiana attenuata]